MKTQGELEAHILLVARDWYAHQCRNPNTRYYWYYRESTQECCGGLLTMSTPPANDVFKIASAEALDRNKTPEDNAYAFLHRHAMRLPIMSIKD